MNRTANKMIRTFREEGAASLVRKIALLARTKKTRLIDDRYWALRGGTRELTIGPTSARFDASPVYGGDAIRWMYLNERQFARALFTELNSDDIFFDVGANVGFFSCFAANRLSDGTVFAFEPFPPNVGQLRRNLRYNDHENAEVEPVALSDATGTAQFTALDEGGVGGQTPSFSSGSDGFSVKKYAADDLIDECVPAPSVVKIDVEGAEAQVIKGMREGLLNDRCRMLMCEIHLQQEGRPSANDYGQKPEDVLDTIRELGFSVSKRHRRGNEVHLVAEK